MFLSIFSPPLQPQAHLTIDHSVRPLTLLQQLPPCVTPLTTLSIHTTDYIVHSVTTTSIPSGTLNPNLLRKNMLPIVKGAVNETNQL